MNEKIKEMNALDAQRKKQQGLGHPIVATMVNDHRMVAVGNTVHYSKNWKTFHDFLRHFFLDSLDRKWLSAQAALPPEQQHIVLRWHDRAMKNLTREGKKIGEIHSAPMTGATRAFLNLAYNIYLIAHHTTDPAVVQTYIARLKSAREDTVTGALFETYAAAAFLKAGFSIEYEKEKGVATSHVEFVATNPKTGAKFSVEVKARERSAAAAAEADPEVDDVKRLRVGNKLSRGPGSNGTETPIQRVSGRQDGLSATNGLPLLPQHRPPLERIKNGSAVGQKGAQPEFLDAPASAFPADVSNIAIAPIFHLQVGTDAPN